MGYGPNLNSSSQVRVAPSGRVRKRPRAVRRQGRVARAKRRSAGCGRWRAAPGAYARSMQAGPIRPTQGRAAVEWDRPGPRQPGPQGGPAPRARQRLRLGPGPGGARGGNHEVGHRNSCGAAPCARSRDGGRLAGGGAAWGRAAHRVANNIRHAADAPGRRARRSERAHA
ncbi:MAG: hypothetical protein J3K34DRAFT_27595 [Monoraphidium minutum]|nr:MAG: hypothetical protein J3K34DRAFT_27595 [Monoraphidium minutum]